MRLRSALVAVLLLVLSACGSATATKTGASSSEKTNPAANDLSFTAQTVSGAEFDGTTLAGKPTVFWFWAPWCPTCRGQIPGVGDLASKYQGTVNVVGVGSLDDESAIADFAAKVSKDVTLLSDDEGAVWRHFGVTAQSTYLVLDNDGEQVATGYLDDAALAQVVAKMVG